MKNFENNLSQGHVGKQLVKFCIPFIISNIIQSLYAVADMIIVGQFSGAVSMSGVNIGSQVTFVLTNLIFGLCAGATVIIGQYMGARDRKSLKETIGTLFTSLLILAGFFTVLMLILKKPFLRLLQTPAPSFEEAGSYLFITTLGLVFIFGYNALSAVMRGMGDSKRPLYFVAIACVVNVGLDLLLVGYYKMGATGAAIATVASQALSMLLCVLYLRRNDFVFDFKLSSFRIHTQRLRTLLKIGVPMSLQNVCVGISFLFLTTMVNIFDPTAVASAAVGAVSKFNNFGVLPAFAMSSAIAAMCAHNIGAGEIERAKKTMKIGMAIAFTMSAAVFAVAQLFPAQIIRVFDDDPALVKAGVEYLRVMSFDYLLVPIFASFNGLFIGAGHTTLPMVSAICSSLLVRIPVCYIFGISLNLGLFGIGLGAPAATIFSVIFGIVFFLSGRWKKATIIHRIAE